MACIYRRQPNNCGSRQPLDRCLFRDVLVLHTSTPFAAFTKITLQLALCFLRIRKKESSSSTSFHRCSVVATVGLPVVPFSDPLPSTSISLFFRSRFRPQPHANAYALVQPRRGGVFLCGSALTSDDDAGRPPATPSGNDCDSTRAPSYVCCEVRTLLL